MAYRRRRSSNGYATRRDRSAHHRDSQAGQATIDYVALVAAIALLIGAGTAIAGGGAGVANAVLGQVRHALCIVTGEACPAPQRRPCVVSSDRDTRHFALSIVIVRVDEDHYVLRERMSDGTVRLTVAERDGAGVEAGIGARAQIKLGRRSIGFDGEARGAAQGVFGSGRVYLARSDREADEILRAVRAGGLRRGAGGPLAGAAGLLAGGSGPRPQEVFVEGGIRGLGLLGLGRTIAGVSLDGLGEAVVGARRDERSGAVTISINAGATGWALLSALLAGPTGSSDGLSGIALTLDRDRRPVELSLSASGTLADGSTVPPGLARALRIGSRRDDPSVITAGRRWEIAARVNLRDPDIAAAWAAFRRDPTDGAAIRALGERLRSHAHVDARSYAYSSESSGFAGGLGLGLRLGGEFERSSDRARLLAASSRPPFGLWERRADCVAA